MNQHYHSNTHTFVLQVFVLLLSFLVTLQQALSSGYINSVITTIEKRFEIPSSLSGLIASSYEIGNVITVIFVSYLGSRRHIPVWIAVGKCRIILHYWAALYCLAGLKIPQAWSAVRKLVSGLLRQPVTNFISKL